MSYYKEIPYFSFSYKLIYFIAMLSAGVYVYFTKGNLILCCIIGVILSLIYFSIILIIKLCVFEKIIIELNDSNLKIIFYNKYFTPEIYLINLSEINEYSEERYRAVNAFYNKGMMIFKSYNNIEIKVPYSDIYSELRTDILNILKQYNNIKIDNLHFE